jgi:hypothetical protein
LKLIKLKFDSNLRLSWQAISLYSITNFIASISAFPKKDIPLYSLIAFSLLITTFTAILLMAQMWFIRVFKNGKFLDKAVWFFSSVISAGFLRGIFFFWSVEMFNLPQPTPLLIRISTSILTTTLWLTFSCILIQATISYSRQFSNLFNQAAFRKALNSDDIAEKPSIDSLDNLVALKKNLAGILNLAKESGVTSDALISAGVAVRNQIEILLKPLSHRLWFNSERNRTQIRLFGLIVDSFKQFSFSSFRLLALWGTLAFASIVNTYEIDRVIFGLFLSLSLLSLTIYVFRIVPIPKSNVLKHIFTVTSIIVISTVPVTMADSLMPLFNYEQMFFPVSAATIVSPIAIAVFLIADSCVNLVSRDRAMIRELFASGLQSDSISNQSAFASYLHNSLQSELTGIAYRLEASAANPKSLKSRETLERLGSLINRSISEDFANFDETPMLRLARSIEAWEGIAKVKVQIDERSKNNLEKLNLVVQVIEEAITNSVRHGRAKNIEVLIAGVNEKVSITINTDSSVVSENSSGLGVAWLEANTVTSTPLMKTDFGTTFKVEL